MTRCNCGAELWGEFCAACGQRVNEADRWRSGRGQRPAISALGTRRNMAGGSGRYGGTSGSAMAVAGTASIACFVTFLIAMLLTFGVIVLVQV